jgi:hypothetical protein
MVGEGEGSVGEGDGVSDSLGVGDGVSDSVGVGEGVSDSLGVGDGVSDSLGVGDGVSDSVTEGEGVGVGVWEGVGLGEGAGSGGNPGTPKMGMVPVNPGGAESLDADWPDTCAERGSEVPDVPGAEAEGDSVGPPCGEPACCAPAFATTW